MYLRASPVVPRLKRLPAMWETWVRSLGRDDPLETEMATHSSILVWKIPWTEEPGGLQSIGSQRVGHGCSDLAQHCTAEPWLNTSSHWKVKVKSLSRVQLFATPWTVAYKGSLSMELSRQEYWSRLPFSSPGDRPDPGIEPRSPGL